LPIELSLLIPATRWTDEIEDAWKAQLGNFQVLEEVRLKGYQLHGVNDWCVFASPPSAVASLADDPG
jgi:hypothetical protein